MRQSEKYEGFLSLSTHTKSPQSHPPVEFTYHNRGEAQTPHLETQATPVHARAPREG